MPDFDDEDESTKPLAPGQQAATQWPAPSTVRLARRAALLWLALALWLAALQWIVVGTPPALLDLSRRIGQLALPSALFLLAPSLFIVPILGLWRGQWSRGLEFGNNIGLIAFMGTALAWAGVGVAYAVDRIDPWEHMPWVTPPYLEAFIAAHPQIEVHKLNGVRDVLIRRAPDGFGRERTGEPNGSKRWSGYIGPTFWRERDGLTDAPAALTVRQVLISGGGDRAMQDFQRAVTGQFGSTLMDSIVAIGLKYGVGDMADWQSVFRRAVRNYLALWPAPARLDLVAGIFRPELFSGDLQVRWLLRRAHPDYCYALNRFLSDLLEQLAATAIPGVPAGLGVRVLRDSEIASISPVPDQTGLVHKCGDAATCLGMPHRVIGLTGAQAWGSTFDVVIVRHGVEMKPLLGRVPVPEQFVPFDVPQ